MFKQLIHYLPDVAIELASPVVVETSPDLTAAQIQEWETQTAAKHAASLPAGRQWGLIDQNHAWFDASQLPLIPVNQGKPGALLTPEQILLRERTPEMRKRFTVEE